MSLWVKICANTSLADAQLAADAGADAVGFVFAPSPRRVTPAQVAEITPNLPATIEKIGVFVEPDFQAMAAAVEQCGLTGVQLHSAAPEGAGQSNSGPASPSIAQQLRQRFGPSLRILGVIHFSGDLARQWQSAQADSNLNGVLIDSRTATAVGGTGQTFDWLAARAVIAAPGAAAEKTLRLIAAGGLNPGNVAQAIATLEPWGVDVASGVEASPGIKDPGKVRAFVLNARAAVNSSLKE